MEFRSGAGTRKTKPGEIKAEEIKADAGISSFQVAVFPISNFLPPDIKQDLVLSSKTF